MIKKGAVLSTLFLYRFNAAFSISIRSFMLHRFIPALLVLTYLAFQLAGCAHEDPHQIHPVQQDIPLPEPIETSVTRVDPPAFNTNSAANEIIRAAIIGAWNGAKNRLSNAGLPQNTRQTKEGYWLGSRPDADEITELYARNVRLILTASTVPYKDLKAIKRNIEALGMTHVYIPFGSKFPHPNKFMPQINSLPPEQIFIHCEHGSDRTGAVLAYILIKRHQWTLPEALFSVIIPATGDIRALAQILKQHGYQIDLNALSDTIGMYSAEKNDGYGGMKVREDGGKYYNLIHTFIKRVEET